MGLPARVASASHNRVSESEMAITEMELLEQNQRRLASLTSRMTTILNGFDRRLVKLESSILPIHRSTQTLSRISHNVEAVQKNLELSLRHYGVVVDDEPAILRGPDPRNPWPYLELIQRVSKDAVAKQARQGTQEQMQSKMDMLVDQGTRKIAELVGEYTTAESQPTDPMAFLRTGGAAPMPSKECLTSVKALLQFLSTLPEAPGTTSSGLGLALQAFANVRAVYLTSSLQALQEHVLQLAAQMQNTSVRACREAYVEYQRGSAAIQEWLRAAVQMIQQEQQALATLFEDMKWDHLRSNTATKVLQPLVASMNQALPAILPRLQHGLNAHRFLTLDFVGACQSVLGEDVHVWPECLQPSVCDSSILVDAYTRSRRDAQLFFPEILRDIKVIPVQGDQDALRVGVSDLSQLGMRLLRGMMPFQDVILGVFRDMGSKNWAESWDASGGASTAVPEVLWSEYCRDLVGSIVSSLERSVAAVPQPIIASIFLLNNVVYLQKELREMAPAMQPLAVQLSDKLLAQAVRSARTAYLESWNPVVQSLVDDAAVPRPSAMSKLGALGDRSARVDPLSYVQDIDPRRFFEHIQDMSQLHRENSVHRDLGLADSLRDDVIRYVRKADERLVGPLYSVTMAKQKSDKRTCDSLTRKTVLVCLYRKWKV